MIEEENVKPSHIIFRIVNRYVYKYIIHTRLVHDVFERTVLASNLGRFTQGVALPRA